MTALCVPPGRAGRMWLRHRLGIARHGSDLLERKLRILREQQQQLAARAEIARQEWQERVTEAETWLLRADLVGGARSLLSAVSNEPADVTIQWATTMGVYHPAEGRCDIPPVPATAASPCGSALVEARAMYRQAAITAVRYAVAKAALARLITEISTTSQRVRALRRRWIPRLEEALARIEFELEELERAEAVRRRSQVLPAAEARATFTGAVPQAVEQ